MAEALTAIDSLIAIFASHLARPKIVFVSLEFIKSTLFSGNGVYARTMVSALIQSHFEVMVICASNTITKTTLTNESLDDDTQCRTLIIPVTKWNVLTLDSDYKLFGSNFLPHTDVIDNFHPDYLLFVDFTSLLVVQNILQHSIHSKLIKRIFLNFRVFHNNSNLTAHHTQERDSYIELETECCRIADKVIALNRNETNVLRDLLNGDDYQKCDHQQKSTVFGVLHPPLRVEVEQIASVLETKPRRYLLCCCRISKEKNVGIFVDVVERLQDFLSDNQIVPYLCGSANESNREYMESLHERLKSVKCECILSPFMEYNDLCRTVYCRTLLNFHPSIKEPC